MASRDELKASVSEQKALNETLMQAIVLTPQNTPQNILSLQIVPNSQNISPLSEQSPPQNNSAPPSPQNISPLSEQSPPQNNFAPPPLSEQSPSQINFPPRGERGTEQERAEQPYVLGSSTETIDANKLTMQQPLDLFELLQARKSKEAEKAVTVEAEGRKGTSKG